MLVVFQYKQPHCVQRNLESLNLKHLEKAEWCSWKTQSGRRGISAIPEWRTNAHMCFTLIKKKKIFTNLFNSLCYFFLQIIHSCLLLIPKPDILSCLLKNIFLWPLFAFLFSVDYYFSLFMTMQFSLPLLFCSLSHMGL